MKARLEESRHILGLWLVDAGQPAFVDVVLTHDLEDLECSSITHKKAISICCVPADGTYDSYTRSFTVGVK